VKGFHDDLNIGERKFTPFYTIKLSIIDLAIIGNHILSQEPYLISQYEYERTARG
jgi:hypothetical protein